MRWQEEDQSNSSYKATSPSQKIPDDTAIRTTFSRFSTTSYKMPRLSEFTSNAIGIQTIYLFIYSFINLLTLIIIVTLIILFIYRLH